MSKMRRFKLVLSRS